MRVETRGRKPTGFPTKQMRIPIIFEKQVKEYVEYLKQHHKFAPVTKGKAKK